MKRLNQALGADGRTLLMRLCGRLHCAVVAAILYATLFDFIRGDGLSFYLRGLLFCIPAAVSFYIAERLPAFWQFLLASLALCGLSWLLMGHPVGAGFTAVLCFFRGKNRLGSDDDEEGEKAPSAFDVPSIAVPVIFLAPFLLSAFLGKSMLQKLSVLSAVLYLLIYLSYEAVGRIDGYLLLNRGMHGLPARRIQRIAGVAAGAAIVLAAALLIPAALGFSGDFRIVIPERKGSPSMDNATPEPLFVDGGGMALPPELADLDTEPWFQLPPEVLYVLYALILGGLLALALYSLYRMLKNFRASYTDSRDEITFLTREEDNDQVGSSAAERRPAFWDRSPDARIRRRYRKTVLKASPEAPRRWHAPREIEESAGLTVPALHELYEKARYGPAPCTEEDLRALKEKT